MPDYVYKCPQCQATRDISHRMLYTTGILCLVDSRPMYRIPQLIRVNWDGPAPSQWEMSPSVKQHVANADRDRGEYLRFKYERESHL